MVQAIVIAPYESFGLVRFGSSEEEVVAAMGQPHFSVDMMYSYGGFNVHFDADGCAGAELFSSPQNEMMPVVDGDLRLIGEFGFVVQALNQRGYETRIGPEHLPDTVFSDVLCDALGIRLWHATEEYVGIESVCAFRRDVYQQMFQTQRRLS